MMRKCKYVLILMLFCAQHMAYAQLNVQESQELIRRVVGDAHASAFQVQEIEHGSQDKFEIGSSNGKIILRGNNGVSIASGLYYYLQEFCNAQITWNGTNLDLPAILPLPENTLIKKSPYEYRYYLNYCTFNYSMSWWDWKRWEQEIDWMALHGINMPLAIVGEEYTWYLVYKEMGFSDEDLKDFFSGPAYFSWFWMGNLDGWGGPLPLSWMESHFELQKKIVERQRALGMKPVLPAFTGHVPASLKKFYPKATLKTTNWTNGFGDTYILDASDPLFTEIGKKFLKKQTELFGTDHLYSADTFNENEPPSDDPEFLKGLSAQIYQGMQEADPEAVWVMQGWLFFSDKNFWREAQTEALLSAVPDDKMIILDLATEIEPVWKRTNAFYGKQWIWNMLNNFGGNTNLFGRMEDVAKEPSLALHDRNSQNLKGIGLTMEAIEQNPVMYELMMANTWTDQPIDLKQWLPKYVKNRYGDVDDHVLKAWDILKNTVYTVPDELYLRDGGESILQARPTLDSSRRWVNTKLNYQYADLIPAWDELLESSSKYSGRDGYQFDIVDLTRQVLANYAFPLQRKFATAYEEGDRASFQRYSKEFITLIEDMDELLGTRNEFLFGRWVEESRAWGVNGIEADLYEFNARDLVTLWGDKDCPLYEYSCRQWNGLMSDFYRPRWEQFFKEVSLAMEKNIPYNGVDFDQKMKEWEWQWVNSTGTSYATKVQNDPVLVAQKMYKKYRPKVLSL